MVHQTEADTAGGAAGETTLIRAVSSGPGGFGAGGAEVEVRAPSAEGGSVQNGPQTGRTDRQTDRTGRTERQTAPASIDVHHTEQASVYDKLVDTGQLL